MPKRKAPCQPDGFNKPSVSSLDAAFDLLANETFGKIDHLVKMFEGATCIRLNEGVAKTRWEEACKRYWVTKAMEDLCCGTRSLPIPEQESDTVEMTDGASDESRPLPSKIHPGPAIRHKMSAGEEAEWKRWTPKVGDLVLVDMRNEEFWPGKVIDRRVFFQGRTAPRGNHFFPVRIYTEGIDPVVTVKSRMVPLDMRPEPPLLAPPTVLTAFHHAAHPSRFDQKSGEREREAALERSHAGVLAPEEQQRVKERKELWNAQVNWIMNERRVEKMRNLHEEREKRLRAFGKEAETPEEAADTDLGLSRSKRNCVDSAEGYPTKGMGDGIFTVPAAIAPSRSSTSSPLFKPVLGDSQRPSSPRRLEKRRNGIYAGMGEYSPRGRRSTYTPPRILPSGDETAPNAQSSPTPVPSSLRFDFVSPLGPVHEGLLENGPRRSGSMSRISLEAVKEESTEVQGNEEWQVVQKKGHRCGSAPCDNAVAGAIEQGPMTDIVTA